MARVEAVGACFVGWGAETKMAVGGGGGGCWFRFLLLERFFLLLFCTTKRKLKTIGRSVVRGVHRDSS